jgi:hypothetical protein
MPHICGGMPFSAASLGKELKMSRQMVSYYMKRMTHLGLLKIVPGVWPPIYTLTKKAKKINVKDFSYSTTMFDIDEKIGMEDVYITIPRDPNCTGNLPKGFWEKINLKMNNNVQKHGHVNLGDYNCSIRETSQSVVIQLGPVKLRDFREAIPIYNELVFRLYNLLLQYNYFIDPTKARCSDPEFTYSNAITKESAKELTEPRVVERLGFPREKMLPGDQPEEAWAKFDNSPETGTFESNHRPLAAAWRSFPLALQTIQEKSANVEKLLQGSVATQNGIANALNLSAAAILEGNKALNELIARLAGVLTPQEKAPPKPPQDAIISALEAMQDWERVRVRIIRNMREFTFNDASGQSKFIPQLKAGSEVYVSPAQAIDLVRWKEAEVVEL